MPCQTGFTDSRCNEQETANPRLVWRGDTPRADAALKTALRLLEDDLERARDVLLAAINEALPELHDDASKAIDAAFADCDWEVERATRALRQALERGPPP